MLKKCFVTFSLQETMWFCPAEKMLLEAIAGNITTVITFNTAYIL